MKKINHDDLSDKEYDSFLSIEDSWEIPDFVQQLNKQLRVYKIKLVQYDMRDCEYHFKLEEIK